MWVRLLASPLDLGDAPGVVNLGRDPRRLGATEADLVFIWTGPLAFDHPSLGRIGPIPFRRTGGHTGPFGMAYLHGPGIIPGDRGVTLRTRMELNEILQIALRAGASDIHLKAGLPPIFRIKGDLRTVRDVPALTREAIAQFAVHMMNERQRAEFEQNLDIDLAYGTPDGVRYRVNLFQQRGSVGMVLRLIPPEVPPFDRLNLPQPVLDRWIRYRTTQHSNIHRAVHYLSETATAEYEAARRKVQAFINAAEDREVIFTSGT